MNLLSIREKLKEKTKEVELLMQESKKTKENLLKENQFLKDKI